MKKMVAAIFLTLLTASLVGCGPSTLVFEGKERPVEEIQDILSDRLEAENPGMDLEIDVYSESDDSSKKKKKSKSSSSKH